MLWTILFSAIIVANLSIRIYNFTAKDLIWLESWIRPGDLPYVYNTSTLPWTATLREGSQTILKELQNYEKKMKKPMALIEEVDANQSILDADKKWRVVFLQVYGRQVQETSEHFPETMALLAKSGAPVHLAMISILESSKVIPPHYGPYAGVLRYHLALEVPVIDIHDPSQKCELHLLPSFTRVPNTRAVPENPYVLKWQVGKDALFDDTAKHHVKCNVPNQRRVVLFLDVIRHDLPLMQSLVNRIILFLVSHSSYVLNMVHRADEYHKN